MDQPGKVANRARGQLNRENKYCPRSHLRIWCRETDSAVLSHVTLLISILRLNLVLRPTLMGTKNLYENGPNPLQKYGQADSYGNEKLIRNWIKSVFF